MGEGGEVTYLRGPDEIEALAGEIREEGLFALDAEFIRERTYYPRLALIQVATSKRSVLIDPVDGADLGPIEDLVVDPDITKLLHAASQDLEIFYYRTGQAPRNVFDTQIAGALCGLGHQCSYAVMVERTTGVSLKKGESYTDWLRRPLSPKQEQYALDDVRYLHQAHEVMRDRLREQGRLTWAVEEMLRYEDASYFEVPDDQIYRKVKRFGTLDPRGLAILRELAAWREEEARRRDRPRRNVIADETLVEIARAAPRSHDDLSRMRGLHPRESKRSGRIILECVDTGLSLAPEGRPKVGKKERLSPEGEAMVDLLQAVLRALCRVVEVAPPVVANARDVEELVREHFAGGCGESESALLRGWRRELVGDELLRFVEGEVSVHLDPETGGPVFTDR
ncbi:MAG: ribonuclease D [Planctomycetota bacterium]|jgi:ribonuclease D